MIEMISPDSDLFQGPEGNYRRLVLEKITATVQDSLSPKRGVVSGPGSRQAARIEIMGRGFDFWFESLDLDPQVMRDALCEKWAQTE